MVDWERRRRNLRILMALKGTNATQVAKEAGLSVNTLSKFTGKNSRTRTLSQDTLSAILPVLGLSSPEELDTDDPLSDPRIAIRRHLEFIPDTEIPKLLAELQSRYPVGE